MGLFERQSDEVERFDTWFDRFVDNHPAKSDENTEEQ